MKGLFIFPVVLFLLFGTPASADFQKGLDAIKGGDYVTALKELQPLAEQGDGVSQYHLGVLYDLGQGVSQDYKVAIKWWDVASSQGFESATENRNLVETYLSPTQMEKAKKLSLECFAKN